MELKQDYSKICTMNDDHDDRCWSCTKFVFPIGCMEGEESEGNDELGEELWGADPNCEHNIISMPSGGVRCTKCKGWCCY